RRFQGPLETLEGRETGLALLEVFLQPRGNVWRHLSFGKQDQVCHQRAARALGKQPLLELDGRGTVFRGEGASQHLAFVAHDHVTLSFGPSSAVRLQPTSGETQTTSVLRTNLVPTACAEVIPAPVRGSSAPGTAAWRPPGNSAPVRRRSREACARPVSPA